MLVSAIGCSFFNLGYGFIPVLDSKSISYLHLHHMYALYNQPTTLFLLAHSPFLLCSWLFVYILKSRRKLGEFVYANGLM